MNKLTKALTVITAGAMCVTALTACGSKSNSGNATSDEILLWSQTTGPDAENAKKTFDAYNATAQGQACHNEERHVQRQARNRRT